MRFAGDTEEDEGKVTDELIDGRVKTEKVLGHEERMWTPVQALSLHELPERSVRQR